MKVLLLTAILLLAHNAAGTRSFAIDYQNDCYKKDGACWRYIAGEMHYFRIPPLLWRDRLLKLRAAGFTTVQTYIPWNVHVPQEGHYKWDGIGDVYRYLELSQELGLTVIVRPGPFLATEWDYGGFPAWLLKDRPTLDVRRNETVFMDEVRKWYAKLLPTLVPYLYNNGGPIIAVQVENEYGSNKPCDAAHFDYLTQLRDTYRLHLGPDVVLLTVDGDSHRLAECGNIEGLYSTVNFGVGGDVDNKFLVQRKQEPHGPFVCSAFFSGWLDHWGHRFAKVDAGQLAKSLDAVLAYNKATASVSMYMFHGGTNFAYMQGGRGDWNNATTTAYPRLWGKMTSYDYDAPLSETGDTTLKYWKIRDVISNYSKVWEVPPNTTKQHVGSVIMDPACDVITLVEDLIPEYAPQLRVESEYPLPMEQMGQNHGVVVYSTNLPLSVELPATIEVQLYGDRIYVFTEGGSVSISSRNRPYRTFTVTQRKLYLLVEDNGHSNTGHVRYSYEYYQKGIVGNVTANGQVLTDWTAYLISQLLPQQPYDEYQHNPNFWALLLSKKSRNSSERFKRIAKAKSQGSSGYIPTLYFGQVNGIVNDTFIDTSGWGKGILATVGKESYNLGRYWPLAGPQKRLYCPGEWGPLPSSSSSVAGLLMLELEQEPSNRTVSVVDTPLVDGTYDPTQQ